MGGCAAKNKENCKDVAVLYHGVHESIGGEKNMRIDQIGFLTKSQF